MCVMDNPVEDGVGHGWLPDAVVPFGDGVLTGNEGGFQAVAVLHDVRAAVLRR